MSPTLLLAVAAALFVAPATYLLAASMLSQQGSLAGRTISDPAEIAIWCAAVASLLIPLSFPRLLRSSSDSVQLLLALVISVSASVFGVALTLTTGEMAPIRMLATASMVAILAWTWVFRERFRSEPMPRVLRRYTTVLVIFGAYSLLYAALRIVLWERVGATSGGYALGGFVIFIHIAVGVSALAVARLRERKSLYALPATRVLSWALLFVPLLGSLAALYWLFAVRRREQFHDPNAHAA